MANIEITDEDREAGAELLLLFDEECGACEAGLMRAGEMDSHPVAQWAARLRIAAFAAGQEKERADVVAWLEEGPIYAEGWGHEYADAISRGEHKSLPEGRNSQPLAD